MNKAPDGPRIFVWRGRNPVEDTARLTEAVAEAAAAELFELNGRLVWFNEGQPIPVTRTNSREIIAKFIRGVRLVHRADAPKWEVESFAFDFPPGADTSKQPNEQVLIKLLDDLKLLVAKGPSQPPRLTPQQLQEIRSRLAIGEPQSRIAEAYKVDLATIRLIVQSVSVTRAGS